MYQIYKGKWTPCMRQALNFIIFINVSFKGQLRYKETRKLHFHQSQRFRNLVEKSRGEEIVAYILLKHEQLWMHIG